MGENFTPESGISLMNNYISINFSGRTNRGLWPRGVLKSMGFFQVSKSAEFLADTLGHSLKQHVAVNAMQPRSRIALAASSQSAFQMIRKCLVGRPLLYRMIA